MFCIAIPLGLARENKGVAAFAGFCRLRGNEPRGQLLADGERHPADYRRGDPQGQQHPEYLSVFSSIDTGILGA